MENWYARTEILIGSKAIKVLQNAKICIFGIGGVGSFAAEALARAGIGSLTLVDGDEVCPSNINRQIHATSRTIGQTKVKLMKARILEINPAAQVTSLKEYYHPEENKKNHYFDSSCDYVVDAIDDLKAKVDIIKTAHEQHVPCISAMGAANKMEPTKIEVADIYSTCVDPLCRRLRKSLRGLGIAKAKVVYSKESPHNMRSTLPDYEQTAQLGSISFVPSVMGLIIASEVVKDLLTKSRI